MPPTTDNSTDPARDGSDEDWARWEQTFRDARPVLPEAAMARIASAIAREADPGTDALRSRSRVRRRIIWLVGILIAINAIVFGVIAYQHRPTAQMQSVQVRDHYPLDVPIGLPLAAPSRPLVPLAENWKWISSDQPPHESADAVSVPEAPHGRLASVGQLKGAERLYAASPDGWHALGLLEMRRAANVSGPLLEPAAPHLAEFRLDALWRMLEEPKLDRFCDQTARLGPGDADETPPFWTGIFKLLCAQNARDDLAAAKATLSNLPHAFPSKAANRARFDMLVEMGIPKVQAALDVLSTRSYKPLRQLRRLESWDAAAPLRDQLHDGYLAGSHDLVERLFALKMMGRSSEVDDLIERANALRYLVDRNDLDVLLARLVPADAWDKLLRPLMEDEVGFIESPSIFAKTAARPSQDVVIAATGKSQQDSKTVYSRPVTLSAGSWQIDCAALSVSPHAAGHAVTFMGSGSVIVRGVVGIFRATAAEMTFNTETGELKLTGGVHLEEWTGSRDLKSCTISRTGEVRPE